MKEKGKKLSKKIIFIIVFAAILGTILIAAGVMQILFVIADGIECWHPDYDKIDIRVILEKDELTDKDYRTLYKQTGVTKIGVDRARARGGTGIDRLVSIQDSFFTYHEVKNDYFAPFICTDYIDENVPYVYLEDGDILYTTSTHLSGWRMGHAGMVVNAASGSVLQANNVGNTSRIGGMRAFTDRVNFVILSPKVDAELKTQVVDYAKNNLVGIPYDPTVGVLSGKNKIEKTQCAHIVWYAYNRFGIDLDSDGGLVVTPTDIFQSPYVEVVQVFGMDVMNLKK